MTLSITINDSQRVLIPLQVKPAHQEIPSFTGFAISKQAGTVLYGHYSMDYRLPDGDFLRLLANHNQKTVQILLLSRHPEKLKNLPGKRPSSLVANTIAQMNRYCIRSESYTQPKTLAQQRKYKIVEQGIKVLSKLLVKERQLLANDWMGQEALRQKVLTIIENCRDDNRLLAINPVVSEGELGHILYEARQNAQHYEFNRVFPVSRLDQLDFSQRGTSDEETCFVWDSNIHIEQDEKALEDALRVIINEYGLNKAASLSDMPANRFKRLEHFFYNRWRDGQDWFNHLAHPKKTDHTLISHRLPNDIYISRIKPWYQFSGLHQKGYGDLKDMVKGLTDSIQPGGEIESKEEAKAYLSSKANGHWVKISHAECLVIRHEDDMITLPYFEEEGLFYPLPHGEDLLTLSRLTKNHLYLPEKIQLQLRAFVSNIPEFFIKTYRSLKRFIGHDLYQDFVNFIHEDYSSLEDENDLEIEKIQQTLPSLKAILEGHGLLKNGQSLDDFVSEKMTQHHWVIVREQHPPSPPPYTNPFHRSLQVLRHFAGFFVDTSERNPIVGSLAIAAYVYGAGAVVAPHTLTALLTKLHLNGLISGIAPTQAFGHWMSHGTTSEAISSAATYWQAITIGGNLDSFFINAVDILQDDPVQVAIIVALALGLGYGLCKTIPSLQEEMGEFPYMNYAAMGAKSGAAIYDTIMNPGEDWLLGTIKWLLKSTLALGKIILGPFIKAYYYGFKEGFLPGLLKSLKLLIRCIKESLTVVLDLLLAIATIPFLEATALLIHVPFRGITNLLSKLLGLMGHWQDLGQSLVDFATRESGWHFLPGFRLSPLYGFHNPLGHYSNIRLLNLVCNIGMCLLLPPLELIKNTLLLPTIDGLSFLTRVALTIINPISRLIAFTLGTLLMKTGFIWDNSMGFLFRGAAFMIRLGSNWLDNEASELKQTCLTFIQYCRRGLYDWAFAEADALIHHQHTDKQYFMEKPMRMEQLPHDKHDCLLHKLFDQPKETAENPDHFPPLFKRKGSFESQSQPSFSLQKGI